MRALFGELVAATKIYSSDPCLFRPYGTAVSSNIMLAKNKAADYAFKRVKGRASPVFNPRVGSIICHSPSAANQMTDLEDNPDGQRKCRAHTLYCCSLQSGCRRRMVWAHCHPRNLRLACIDMGRHDLFGDMPRLSTVGATLGSGYSGEQSQRAFGPGVLHSAMAPCGLQ